MEIAKSNNPKTQAILNELGRYSETVSHCVGKTTLWRGVVGVLLILLGVLVIFNPGH